MPVASCYKYRVWPTAAQNNASVDIPMIISTSDQDRKAQEELALTKELNCPLFLVASAMTISVDPSLSWRYEMAPHLVSAHPMGEAVSLSP